VSSHALDQNRLGDVRLDAAVITNVTHDHFDYHGTYESYLTAKARIIGMCTPGSVIAVNADDPGSHSLMDRIDSCHTAITYGLDRPAQVSAVIDEETLTGTCFQLRINGLSISVRTPLIGRHNVSNCLAAASVATHFGCPANTIATGIEALTCVPGRLETIDCHQPFEVFVDYAHTEDALERVLASLRPLTSGNLICVIGAGGDRDVTKRPLLGKAASKADIVIITSDNPRNEEPTAIIKDILSGCDCPEDNVHVDPDRAKAILMALKLAKPGDAVLVSGKGHETEQIIGNRRLPFDDRAVIRQCFHSHSQDTHRPPVSATI
jgi:UDP-N-acetylmuramoyl-L-alanyl-D-glutamate--2,6-diaminopimelate ligase